MSIMQKLTQPEAWEQFYQHKLTQGNLGEKQLADLRAYIDKKEYLAALAVPEFPAPEKSLIGKSGSTKKRTVYTFDREYGYVLKLIAFLLYDYDGIFCDNLYSFRKNSGVKKAVDKILHTPHLDRCYVYKADIRNYFGDIDTDILVPRLKRALSGDKPLFEFLEKILRNPYAVYEGRQITENKGALAGVPVSGFFANLYLCDLDRYFYEKSVPYIRYSDDILVFAKSREQLEEYIRIIKDFLSENKLSINPEKETVYSPGQKLCFLGFSYQGGTVDVSELSVLKLTAKMRRKARALSRWADRKGLSRKLAARAFVKRFNAKLYENPVCNELTWTRWFFPVINTCDSLRKIDAYMQDCIRTLATGKHTKKRFDMRYDDIKALGYKSLINEYYKFKSTTKD